MKNWAKQRRPNVSFDKERRSCYMLKRPRRRRCQAQTKRTRMPNPVGSPGYINCYSLSSPRPIRYNYQNICSWLRWPGTVLLISMINSNFQINVFWITCILLVSTIHCHKVFLIKISSGSALLRGYYINIIRELMTAGASDYQISSSWICWRRNYSLIS